MGEYIQHLGLVAIILLSISGFYTMRRWPMAARRSFSENVARDRSSLLFFGIYLTITTVVFYAFLLFWLGPNLGVGLSFYVLAWTAFFLQLLLSWVPATTGRSMAIHNVGAYGIAFIIPLSVMAILLTATVEVTFVQRVIVTVFMVITAIIFSLLFFVPKARNFFLYGQLAYFASFWVVVLAFTYL